MYLPSILDKKTMRRACLTSCLVRQNTASLSASYPALKAAATHRGAPERQPGVSAWHAHVMRAVTEACSRPETPRDAQRRERRGETRGDEWRRTEEMRVVRQTADGL